MSKKKKNRHMNTLDDEMDFNKKKDKKSGKRHHRQKTLKDKMWEENS